MNTLLPKFWTHSSNTRELSDTQETSSTCSVNAKYILKNSRNSGQTPLSAGDGLPALTMADHRQQKYHDESKRSSHWYFESL